MSKLENMTASNNGKFSEIVQLDQARGTVGNTSPQIPLGISSIESTGLNVSAEIRGEYLMTVDWLEFHCIVDPSGVEDGETVLSFTNAETDREEIVKLSFFKQDYSLRFYKDVWKINYDGKPFAVLTCNPTTSKITHNGGSLKIENQQLYSPENLRLRINALAAALGMQLRHVTRLDIALDGSRDLLDRLNDAVLGTDYRFVTRSAINPENFNLKTKRFDQFGVGRRSSRRFFYAYNKTKEIASQEGKKDYIADWHKENGLSGEVYRYEIRFRREGLKMVDTDSGELIENPDMDCWFDPDFLQRVYLSAFDSIVGLRLNDNKRSNRCTPVQFLPDVPADQRQLKVLRAVPMLSLRQIKIQVKNLISQVVTSAAIEYDEEGRPIIRNNGAYRFEEQKIKVARAIVVQNSLRDWISERSYEIEEDIRKRARYSARPVHEIGLSFSSVWSQLLERSAA